MARRFRVVTLTVSYDELTLGLSLLAQAVTCLAL